MKRTLLIAALPVLAAGCLTSCMLQRSVSVSQAQNNPDYTVSYLFEHDGCRVYRFYDALSDSYVYFTTQGDVTGIANDSVRQQTVTYRHRDRQPVVKPSEPQP